MGVDHRARGQEAAVRDAPRADAAVVAGHVVHQPLDRVVEVGGLVGAVDVAGLAVGAQRDEFALGLVAPTQVLQHEDVPLVEELLVPVQPDGVLLLLRIGVVGRALQHDRERLGPAPRDVDLGVQPHPVAHGHHDVPLGLEDGREVEVGAVLVGVPGHDLFLGGGGCGGDQEGGGSQEPARREAQV